MEAASENCQGLLSKREIISDTMQVLRILTYNESIANPGAYTVSPSTYMRHMLMSTAERTANLTKHARNLEPYNKSSISLITRFRATPNIVIFQQCIPGITYSVAFTIRNITRVSQHLNVACANNPWFTVEFKGPLYKTKLAPGISLTFEVKFCPDKRQDYEYEVPFVSGLASFTVPVLAIGPRALLYFPDFVELPVTAVKSPSTASFIVRNVGDISAAFTLKTFSPFSITPERGVLEEGDTKQITATFLSAIKGYFMEKLIVTYEAGETIHVSLRGSAKLCDVQMDRESITMDNTYLGLTRSTTLSLRNNSDYVTKFQWMRYADTKKDRRRKEKYQQSFEVMKDFQVIRSLPLEYHSVCTPPVHELACERIYNDELSSLSSCIFPFQHANFKLTPLGEIWPHCSKDFIIIFEPDEIGATKCQAYLEVTGLEERLRLKLRGTCIGPLLKLNVAIADVGNLFLCSPHHAEIICTNEGDIPGTMIHRPKPTDFGCRIKVSPAKIKLQPGTRDSFNISFSSNRKGNFKEKVEFVIKESSEVIVLQVRGCIICPTLHFDKPNLEFNVTALGFTTKREVALHNDSSVPVTFSLSVIQRGTQPALTCEEFARSVTKPKMMSESREFSVTPVQGVVAPRSSRRIKVSYTPNVVRSSETTIRVDIPNSYSEPVILPIIFGSKVASLVMKPKEIFIDICFINFPYTRSITVENESDVEGYFYLPAQTASSEHSIVYSLSSNQGHLKPHQSKSISLTIITSDIGRQEGQINMLSFGEKEASTCCQLTCNGQGPDVTIFPKQLDFGQVQLLDQQEARLTLTNNSPIPAQFKSKFRKLRSCCSVHPTIGELEPGGSQELRITICLRDAGKYSDEIRLEIVNTRVMTCPLIAVGIGTSIVFSPKMLPTFDMGLVFSHQDLCIPVTVKNLGTIHHQLIWIPKSEVASLQRSVPRMPKYEKFTIDPFVTELPPGAERTIYCKIHWLTNETVSEEWYLYALIQGSRKREIIGNSNFTATFVNRDISYSQRKLRFRYDATDCGARIDTTESLLVTNNSRLDFIAHLHVDAPFEIITADGDSVRSIVMKFVNQETSRVVLKLNAEAVKSSKLCSKVIRGNLTLDYGTHPIKDTIKCIAELNYPNVSLSPKRLILDCEIGSSVQKNILLANNGALPVHYSFEWSENSIKTLSALPIAQFNDARSLLPTSDVASEEPVPSVEDLSPPKCPYPSEFEIERANPSPASDPDRVSGKNVEEAYESNALRDHREITDTISVAETEVEQTRDEASVTVDSEDLFNFIFPMLDKYLLPEDAIPILEAMQSELPRGEPITEILDVVPKKGIVAPHSAQYVYLSFDPSQRVLQVEAKLVCNVKGGPIEMLEVRAVSDVVRYSVDKTEIDFGSQLFCDVFSTNLTITNESMIRFGFHANTRDSPSRINNSETRSGRLVTNPKCGTIDAMSSIILEIEYHQSIPGSIDDEIEIEIAHLTPLVIPVTGCGIFPQVRLSIPRVNAFDKLAVELCYQAISTLTTDFLMAVRERLATSPKSGDDNDDAKSPTSEEQYVEDHGWEVISLTEIFPTVIDIEMAVENFLAIDHIREQSKAITSDNPCQNEKGISLLSFPDYIIDFGFVIVEQTVQYSAVLTNYGATTVEVWKKNRAKSLLTAAGISVTFREHQKLLVGESIPLNVTFQPKRSRYSAKRSDVEFRIDLEVVHGCVLPIFMRGIVTYPFVVPHAEQLDFGDVAVGNCMLMPLRLRNEGWVPCEWRASVQCTNTFPGEQNPEYFYLHRESDTFWPGYENVMSVYFKPKKARRSVARLIIESRFGIAPVAISLSGSGIAPRLSIRQRKIIFDPVIPYTSDEKTFEVENLSPYPVEFFWRNFDSSFLEENRLVRVLTHYYSVDDLLVPVRHPGDRLSPKLYAFYQNLTDEMKLAHALDEGTSLERRDRYSQVSSVLGTGISREKASSDETETLLHSYIDELRKREDFTNVTREPLVEISNDVESTSVEPKESRVRQRFFIIFHGAPFTDYRRVANRAARIIGVPVLDIDKAIIEITALGNTECSKKLREIIDEKYSELLSRSKAYRDKLTTSDLETSSSQSNDNDDISVLIGSRILESSDDFHHMEAIDVYETKIQSILVLQRIISGSSNVEEKHLRKMRNDNDRENISGKTSRSSKKRVDSSFLGISKDLLFEALEQRISMEDFDAGFVLESLDNIFVNNQLDTLLKMLSITKNATFFAFVTIHNDLSKYLDHNNRIIAVKRSQEADELRRKISDMEEMSASEVENLGETDQIFYSSKVLDIKRENHIRRRALYDQRLSQARLKRKHPIVKSVEVKKSSAKTSKGGTTRSDSVKSVALKSKQAARSAIERKTSHPNNSGRDILPKKTQAIAMEMEMYEKSLAKLLSVLDDWEPRISSYSNSTSHGSAKNGTTSSVQERDKTLGYAKQNNGTEEFHIWHVLPTDPWSHQVESAVMSVLADISDTNDATEAREMPKFELDQKLYSVIDRKSADDNTPKPNDAYTLTSLVDAQPNYNAPPMNSTDDRSHVDFIKGSREETFEKLSTKFDKLAAKTVEESVTPREIIQPKEIRRFKVRFHPKRAGVYEQDYRLSLVGSNVTYSIAISGSADIPRLNMNPAVIFNKVKEFKRNDSHHPTYFSDTKSYDFGSILLSDDKEKRVPHRETRFVFSNISTLSAEVTFCLANNSGAFKIEPEKLTIEPSESSFLHIWAGVSKLGWNSERLLICVRNNPTVHDILLRSHGSRLELDLEGKMVSFDRILLYRKETRKVIVRNKCNVAIHWLLESLEKLDPQIIVSPIRGVAKPLSSTSIEFDYSAGSVGIIEKRMITFKAFLNEVDTEVLYKESITVTGETYDVQVDVVGANPIDLKNIKVGTSATESFVIKNRGIYPIKFSVEPNSPENLKLNLPSDLREQFSIDPSSGTLAPDKSSSIMVIFTPRIELTIAKAPLFKCHLTDTNEVSSAVAEIPLTVSVKAQYAKLKIHPSSELNYGALRIFNARTLYLNIENTGSFSFKYEITGTQISERLPSTSGKNNKPQKQGNVQSNRKKKSPRSSRTTKSTSEQPRLRVGPFSIEKNAGELKPANLDTIAIECRPESAGLFQEEISIFVPDAGPVDESRRVVRLLVNACIPCIDLHDFDAMFQQNLVVDSIGDFVCAKEVGEQAIFGKQDTCLYFPPVCVGHACSANFRLHNPGLVCSDVAVTLQKNAENRETEIFSISPPSASISPQCSTMFSIIFKPLLLETYTAVFDVVVEMPTPLKNLCISIKLYGEGRVPEISLIEPISPSKNHPALLHFGRMILGDEACRSLSFKNTGSIKAKVVIEIHSDTNMSFALGSCNVRDELRETLNSDVSDRRCLVCSLLPEEIRCINVKLVPNNVGKCDGQIRLFVADNPYERISITLLGECRDEIVILKGIKPIDSRSASSFTSNKSLLIDAVSRSRKNSRNSGVRNMSAENASSPLAYKLDFGACFLNKANRICFKIINRSNDKCFRFHWITHPEVVFSPSIGHLKQQECKHILATFFTSEPTQRVGTLLECTVEEIILHDEVFWDDEQSHARWEPRKSNVDENGETREIHLKIIEPMPEPRHDVVPGSAKVIPVILTVMADYSRYDCGVIKVNFGDTMMFQNVKYEFALRNSGTVNLEYQWNFITNESSSSRLSNSTLRSILESLEAPTSVASAENVSDIQPDQSSECTSTSETAQTMDHKDETNCSPFGIEPKNGVVLPGEFANCTLTFSPLDVANYKTHLSCRIENIDPELPELNILVKGRSSLPYCHFYIPESDYLTSRRRNSNLLEHSDNVKVVELSVMGIGKTHIKKFSVINPTAEDYHFSWRECRSRCTEDISYFRCLVNEGVVERGKQTELAFDFLAPDKGIFESLWTFFIKEHELEMRFLLVATVTEPRVCFSPARLEMEPTIIDVTVRDSLVIVNHEDTKLFYRIIPDSLYSEGRVQRLCLEPISGVLQPNSEQILSIEFEAKLSGDSEFSIECLVEKMKKPLIATVLTTTYVIEPLVTCTNEHGAIRPISREQINKFDFGKLVPNKPDTLEFKVTNTGKGACYYTWDLGTNLAVGKVPYTLAVQPHSGHVSSASRAKCLLTITAHRKTINVNHAAALKIKGGPEYRMLFTGMARKAIYKFNCSHYDFGPRYIEHSKPISYTMKIIFSNNGEEPCILECKFVNLPYFTVEVDRCTEAIQGHSSLSIPVKFTPLESKRYREEVTFVINSVVRETIVILGEGIPYEVCLVNPKHKVVDMGNVVLGTCVKRKVPIINKGRAPLRIKVNRMTELPEFENFHDDCSPRQLASDDRAKTPTDEKEATGTGNDLTISPSDLITLAPGKEIPVIVAYNPAERISSVTYKIACQINETILPLFVVKGGCMGAEFSLSHTHLLYDTVIDGCSQAQKIVLRNSGDIGGKFDWNLEELNPQFHLTPRSGYCSPGKNVPFVVTFSPSRQCSSIEGLATLRIENYKPLRISMIGSCGKLPDPIETLHLNYRVRESATKHLTISNYTNQDWRLTPIASGDYFSSATMIFVPSKQSTSCEITYHPLRMTNSDGLHEGKLIFKLPDGKVQHYKLVGTSLPPEPVAKLVREFPAKTQHIENLSVANWLRKLQRFSCAMEVLSKPKGNPIYNLSGDESIDVSSADQRDYRCVFYSYKEGNFNFKVTFTNSDGEYLYYELSYKITKPDVLEYIKMTTPVRTFVCHILKLANPLRDQPIVYAINTPHPDITVVGSPVVVNPETTEIVKIEFYPLTLFETEVLLEATCSELGIYPYNLSLKSTPALPEKPTRISAVIGSSMTLAIRLKNLTRKVANFSIQVDHPAFLCESNVSVPGSKEVVLNPVFEPCDVGHLTATLTATSETAGEYKFPLIATVTVPKPQGPFAVKRDEAISIPFKNIFLATKIFRCYLDAPEIFDLKNSLETIKTKETVKLMVQLSAQRGNEDNINDDLPLTGKLVVHCTDVELSHIKWFYYLRGIVD